MMGLEKELDAASLALMKAHVSISLKSGAALFRRYVTRAYDDIPVRILAPQVSSKSQLSLTDLTWGGGLRRTSNNVNSS